MTKEDWLNRSILGDVPYLTYFTSYSVTISDENGLNKAKYNKRDEICFSKLHLYFENYLNDRRINRANIDLDVFLVDNDCKLRKDHLFIYDKKKYLFFVNLIKYLFGRDVFSIHIKKARNSETKITDAINTYKLNIKSLKPITMAQLITLYSIVRYLYEHNYVTLFNQFYYIWNHINDNKFSCFKGMSKLQILVILNSQMTTPGHTWIDPYGFPKKSCTTIKNFRKRMALEYKDICVNQFVEFGFKSMYDILNREDVDYIFDLKYASNKISTPLDIPNTPKQLKFFNEVINIFNSK